MRVSYAHGGEASVVRQRLEELVPRLLASASSQASNVDYQWDGDVMRFSFWAMGRPLSGTAMVTDEAVVIDMGLPLLVRQFEGRIRTRIIETLDGLLK